MPDANDMDLVREFARTNSEVAFTELVRRHVNLVHSVARRCTGTESDAQDVTQAVFIILARKAASLRERTLLVGWLYKTTRFTAARLVRTNVRRHAREQEAYMQSTLNEANNAADSAAAWEKLSPHLEAAMSELADRDRDALLLRFYENKSVQEIAAALCMEESAAQKRVMRAVEKLRKAFADHGVALTATAIVGAVSTNSVQVAPVAMAKMISVVAVGKGATAGASTLTLVKGALKIMAWSKMKAVAVVGAGVLFAAGTTTVLVKEFGPVDDNWFQTSSEVLNNAPANLKIFRSTHFGKPGMGGGMLRTPERIVCVNLPLERELMFAYNFSADSSRMELPRDFPTNGYDCLITLPHDRNDYSQDKVRGIMRDLIKEKFGLVARLNTRDRDGLLLRVKNADAVGLQKTVQDPLANSAIQSSIHGLNSKNFPLNGLAYDLEGQLGIPIEDQTGLTNRIVLDLRWDKRPGETTLDTIKRVVLDQLGLELVPTNMPVETLVIERKPQV